MLVSRSVWAVQSWRLATLQDVMLSGFQLELYSPSERAFAYWYTSIIIDGHLQALDILLGVVPQGLWYSSSATYHDLTFFGINSKFCVSECSTKTCFPFSLASDDNSHVCGLYPHPINSRFFSEITLLDMQWHTGARMGSSTKQCHAQIQMGFRVCNPRCAWNTARSAWFPLFHFFMQLRVAGKIWNKNTLPFDGAKIYDRYRRTFPWAVHSVTLRNFWKCWSFHQMYLWVDGRTTQIRLVASSLKYYIHEYRSSSCHCLRKLVKTFHVYPISLSISHRLTRGVWFGIRWLIRGSRDCGGRIRGHSWPHSLKANILSSENLANFKQRNTNAQGIRRLLPV